MRSWNRTNPIAFQLGLRSWKSRCTIHPHPPTGAQTQSNRRLCCSSTGAVAVLCQVTNVVFFPGAERRRAGASCCLSRPHTRSPTRPCTSSHSSAARGSYTHSRSLALWMLLEPDRRAWTHSLPNAQRSRASLQQRLSGSLYPGRLFDRGVFTREGIPFLSAHFEDLQLLWLLLRHLTPACWRNW